MRTGDCEPQANSRRSAPEVMTSQACLAGEGAAGGGGRDGPRTVCVYQQRGDQPHVCDVRGRSGAGGGKGHQREVHAHLPVAVLRQVRTAQHTHCRMPPLRIS